MSDSFMQVGRDCYAFEIDDKFYVLNYLPNVLDEKKMSIKSVLQLVDYKKSENLVDVEVNMDVLMKKWREENITPLSFMTHLLQDLLEEKGIQGFAEIFSKIKEHRKETLG